MGAPTKDEARTFPDGIEKQTIRVTFVGTTVRQRGGHTVYIPSRKEIVLELDPTATAYDAAGIENEVVKALNDVQGQLATERGEAGV